MTYQNETGETDIAEESRAASAVKADKQEAQPEDTEEAKRDEKVRQETLLLFFSTRIFFYLASST